MGMIQWSPSYAATLRGSAAVEGHIKGADFEKIWRAVKVYEYSERQVCFLWGVSFIGVVAYMYVYHATSKSSLYMLASPQYVQIVSSNSSM